MSDSKQPMAVARWEDALVRRWRSDADAYMRQIDEARAKGIPHDQMLAMMTCLRACARELELATLALRL